MRLILGTVLLLALTACGDGEASDAEASADASRSKEAKASASASASAEAEEEEREREARAEAQRAYRECSRVVQPLLTELQSIDSRLSIGLNFDEYGDRLGDAQVAYDALARDVPSETNCLSVAIGLEEALNKYSTVYNVWNDCIQDLYCNFNEGAPNRKAQRLWARSSRFVERAQTNLDKLKP